MTENDRDDAAPAAGDGERTYDGHKVVLVMLLLFVLMLAFSAWMSTIVMSSR